MSKRTRISFGIEYIFWNGKQDFELFRKQSCCYFNVCKFLRNLFSLQTRNTICSAGLWVAVRKGEK